MTCDDAQEQILVADLAELRGEGDTPLVRHLQRCDVCRASAKQIVQTENALGVAFDAMTLSTNDNGVTKKTSTRITHWAPTRWGVIVPLAAAASLAVLLFRNGVPVSTPMPQVQQPVVVPVVQPHNDQNVAVFNTDDPNIVVVWFLGGNE